MTFKPVSAKVDFPKLEEEILKFWKKNKVFEKSVEQRPKDNPYYFYDGPPFVTGLPHYGHLLGNIAKDVVPRYFTMKGYRVERVWGWDCHGLPVEEKTEKKLGLKNRRDIEKIGIDKFIRECRKYVSETSAEWNWYVDRIARWVDMDNAYRTMDLKFMESVIWAFKQLYDKGLIYQGLKTLLYCTRCGTPVSKFEIAMDDSYAMMQDSAATVKFKLKDKKFADSFILAWTTTPWTLPSNRALVIDEREKYVKVKMVGSGGNLILAKKRLKEALKGEKFKKVQEFKGKALIGLGYEPLYTFFPASKRDFKVYSYEGMVNMDEGTGVVHSAPGFGEIDTEMGKHFGLTLMFSVDDEGKFVDQVEKWAGVYVKDADQEIISDLKKRDLLFKEETISHRYPYCYRCETPLIYKAVKAWFVNIQKNKKKMLDLNKNIHWVPAHFKKGRVNYTIQEAPDWCVSRTRYWATVMPVWQCEKCGELEVVGSIKEIEENSVKKVKVVDLHRTGVDHIRFKCQKCNSDMHRIPEVLDVWFESGSMPYGERHYPFEKKLAFEKSFPADYIVEYVGQIRAWFYYLHVLSTVLFDSHCFKNVVVTGVMAGTDGRKMSKSYGNYPDPRDVLQTYGGDALRLYLMGSVLMLGRDMNITRGEEIAEQIKIVLLPLWNSYKFFITFANLHDWKPDGKPTASKNLLDKWIVARLNQFHQEFTGFMDAYHIPQATHLIRDFVGDLSRWYIRRSRERFNKGDKKAIGTLYYALSRFVLIAAPIIPFTTEEIYQGLIVPAKKAGRQKYKGLRSVHLEDWPKAGKVDRKLLADMELVRKICEIGHAARKGAGIKVRQPLKKLKIMPAKPGMLDKIGKNEKLKIGDELVQLIKDELNVKEVVFKETKETKETYETKGREEIGVWLDTKITPELKAEGETRELVRQIQELRKKAGCKLDQKIKVYGPEFPKKERLREYVKKKTLAEELLVGKKLRIVFTPKV